MEYDEGIIEGSTMDGTPLYERNAPINTDYDVPIEVYGEAAPSFMDNFKSALTNKYVLIGSTVIIAGAIYFIIRKNKKGI